MFGRNQLRANGIVWMKFIGKDSDLCGVLIEHGKEYVIRHTNRRDNGWLWIDIYVNGEAVPCGYTSLGTFMQNWELI